MALKVINQGINSGWDAVGADDYRAGQIAARDASGNAILCGSATDSTNNGTKPIGIFGDDHITTSLQQTAQWQETITVTATAVAISLAHNALVGVDAASGTVGGGSELVTVGGVTMTAGNTSPSADYAINCTNGTITFNFATHAQTLPVTATITYTYKLNDQFEKDFRGTNYKGVLDDTEGSKKSTIWKGYGEYLTDQYVTTQVYAVGDVLRPTKSGHAMGAGLLTKESSGGNVAAVLIARVTQLPTASDPQLGFELIPITN
jgi:hypothetical protein